MAARTATTIALAVLLPLAWVSAQQRREGVAIDRDDIGGVVTGLRGPEAGVWVIAETTELPTTFAKIVVTDDQGRYVVPDLPNASYRVWVRGYGLVDSAPVTGRPGTLLNLTANAAPTAIAAAQYFPADSWLSLLRVPDSKEFPGTGREGNGIPDTFQTQQDWLASVKTTCLNCHQIGNKATREIPEALGRFQSSVAAWDHRVQVGQAGSGMSAGLTRLGRQRVLAMFGDWTDRIAAGEVPPTPPRPTGIERNLVVTLSDVAAPASVMRDETVTDKRNPRLNANGPVYLNDGGGDRLVAFDPKTQRETAYNLPTTNPRLTSPLGAAVTVPSPYWGSERYWNNPGYPHSIVMDQKGRIWSSTTARDPQRQPDFCKEGSTNPFAQYFPLTRSGVKQVVVFDPATKQFDVVDTCFTTHHLRLASDRDNTVHFSNTGGSNDVVGWVNMRILDETKSAEKAQGWCPAVLDTNGDGTITRPWTEPDQPVDPTKDHRVQIPAYGNSVNPIDHSHWVASGQVLTRLELGANPPQTCRAERFVVPDGKALVPHGVDVDGNGVAWVNFSGTGQLASFDRRKCKVLNGPTATGAHCPEGWAFYDPPGPRIQGTSITADWTYVPWVDQFNTLGLGENIPMTQGTNADALYAFNPKTREWVTLRVPYPLGYFARLNDGRIDDPNGGWKGRGMWSSFANLANWHIEGGKGAVSKVVKFQLRPDPLAR